MKYIPAILAAIFMASCTILSCHSKSEVISVSPKADTPQAVIKNNQEKPWTMDSIAAYIERMGRCKHLEDSEKSIYIIYAQGDATFEQYQHAHGIYEKYFKEVYQPSYKRLCKHTK